MMAKEMIAKEKSTSTVGALFQLERPMQKTP